MSGTVLASEQDATLAPLRDFVIGLADLVGRETREDRLLTGGKALLATLLETDAWLPEAYAQPNPERYTQYSLYVDPADRFSVVSFVWGPGQRTPVHDHTVWGLVGVLRGVELVEQYQHRAGHLTLTGSHRLSAGEIDLLSPALGDIHKVSNGLPDEVSVSIHVYGADIGIVERSVFELDGTTKPFISRYADAPQLQLGIQ